MMETFMVDYLGTTSILVKLPEPGVRFGHAVGKRLAITATQSTKLACLLSQAFIMPKTDGFADSPPDQRQGRRPEYGS